MHQRKKGDEHNKNQYCEKEKNLWSKLVKEKRHDNVKLVDRNLKQIMQEII